MACSHMEKSVLQTAHIDELEQFRNLFPVGNSRTLPKAWCGCACRYLKGDRLFPGNAAIVAPTGLGTVGAAGGSTAVSAAEEGKLEAGVGEVIEAGAVKPAPPTLRARIVGQGYKQVSRTATLL